MTNIVVMKAWREQHPGKVLARPALNSPAKVLIYMGVRYERREAGDHLSMDMVQVRAEQN